MNCPEAICERILSLSAVTALINARAWTNHYPPRPTMPAVLVQQIGGVIRPHLRGTDRLRTTRIQVDVIAPTIKEARDVDAAILGDYSGGSATGLEGFAGTVGSVTIASCFPMGDPREEYESEASMKQARTIREYRVSYEA